MTCWFVYYTRPGNVTVYRARLPGTTDGLLIYAKTAGEALKLANERAIGTIYEGAKLFVRPAR